MGSASTQASAAVTAALNAASAVDLTVADELFAAARALADAPQLAAAMSDRGAADAARASLVTRVFASLGVTSRAVLTSAATQRWSTATDLVDSVEESAIRAAVIAQPDAEVDRELFQVTHLVAQTPTLELALGSRLGDPVEKGRMVHALLDGRVSAAAALVVASIVQRSRERRVRELLGRAETIAAAQRGRMVATVTTVAPLSDAQRQRLQGWLAAKYHSDITVNTLLDPSVIGGLRVKVADDVIDATVSSRMADLRNRLAG